MVLFKTYLKYFGFIWIVVDYYQESVISNTEICHKFKKIIIIISRL